MADRKTEITLEVSENWGDDLDEDALEALLKDAISELQACAKRMVAKYPSVTFWCGERGCYDEVTA